MRAPSLLLMTIFLLNPIFITANQQPYDSIDRSMLTNNSLKLNYFRGETSDFDVDVYFVGTGSVEQEKIEPDAGIYRIKSNFAFTPITIKANITGYTSWNLGNVSLMIAGVSRDASFGNQTATFGQIYVFVDNTIRLVRGVELGIFGISVIIPQGDHTVSLLYIGKDEEKGMVYDHHDFTVQIRKEDEEFEEYMTRDVQLELKIVDEFEEGVISGEVIVWSGEPMFPMSEIEEGIPDKRIIFEPMISTSSFFDNGTDQLISRQMELLFLNETGDKISIEGTVNTTGFDGLQVLQTWNTTKGIIFFMDASGLHEMGLQTIDKASIRQGTNYLGVIAIAPYGLIHKDIPCFDGSLCEGWTSTPIDWEYKVRDVEGLNASGDPVVEIDSSFDYIVTSDGVIFSATFGETTVVTSTETEESDGFTLFVSMLSIFLIRIIIYRSNMKKNLFFRRNKL